MAGKINWMIQLNENTVELRGKNNLHQYNWDIYCDDSELIFKYEVIGVL